MKTCRALIFSVFACALLVCLSANSAAENPEAAGPVGFDEKLGAYVPLDLPFNDESGNKVLLRDVVKGPTILTIVYYTCSNACSYFETSVAGALRGYITGRGSEPNMVSVSINEAETAGDALNAKRLAIESIEKPFPDEKWHFLRGDSESIRKITDATGYRYVRNGNVFDHPLGLIILSPQGKIVRYIVGPEILPIDLSISLMEASSGVVSPTIARVLRYCFSYDPKSHLFVFNILRVSGSAVFLLAGIFIVYLMVSGNKRRTVGGR